MPRQILWHFIPPSSPHFGDLLEANIKTLKCIVRSVLNETELILSEFNMLIIQVEANLNSRPLTQISDNWEDLEAITPGHFLTGGNLVTIPEIMAQSSAFGASGRMSMLHSYRTGKNRGNCAET